MRFVYKANDLFSPVVGPGIINRPHRTWLLAANAVQGEKIGNLNIPAVLDYRVKTKNHWPANRITLKKIKLNAMLSELKPYITAIVFSPTLLLLGIAFGLWLSSKKPKLGNSLAVFSTALLWIFSTPAFNVWLSHNLLTQYTPTTAQELKAQGVQAIVVLGGGVETGQPDGIQQLQATALDRLRHGIELSRKTGIPVMVTGGKGWGAKADSENEAEISRRVAREAFQFQIQWTESGSRDTQENASNSKELLTMQGISKIALVTHSWHMPRSLNAFQKVGFEVTPAPMGFVADKKVDLLSLLPNGGALNSTRATFKELVAQAVQGQ